MLFNSYIFLFLFLPLFLLFWWFAPVGRRTKLIGLTIASYVFYGYWDWRFTLLMLVSTVVDYLAGARIHQATSTSRRRLWLVVSLAANLGILGFFKYSGFLASSLNELSRWIHMGLSIPSIDVVLPVGISFYTFQSMSYSIDIYRREARPTMGFWRFAAYVSMFPQLVAGPIVRYSEIETQLREATLPPTAKFFALGIHFFVLGLAKKLLIADPVANQVNPLFDAGTLSFIESWMATLGYTVQIYFDFSGYSDMAVGLGYMLGFKLPQNFDSPYKSKHISAFWRKWHMTLSFWLRDYLYISLGGSRHGRAKTLRNLMITMFLGGLWHGAAWTFVAWGVLHGAYLIVHNLWRRLERPLPRVPAVVLTFLAVVIGWVFFRAPTFDRAFSILASMSGMHGVGTPGTLGLKAYGLVAAGLSIAFFAPNTWEIEFRATKLRAAVAAVLFVLCVMRLSVASPFLYFQF